MNNEIPILYEAVSVWVKASDEFPEVKGRYITRRPTLNKGEYIIKEEVFNPRYEDIKERWISFEYEWQKVLPNHVAISVERLRELEKCVEALEYISASTEVNSRNKAREALLNLSPNKATKQ